MIIGEFQHKLIYPSGKTIIRPWQRNMIVKTMGNLEAARLMGDATITGPIQYWAIGSGDLAWDTTPGLPNVNDTALVNEIYRKAITLGDMQYVDSLGAPSASNTNRLEITLVFGLSEANGDWREFGIFGGNATGSMNTGIMINHKIHTKEVKDSSFSLETKMRFTF